MYYTIRKSLIGKFGLFIRKCRDQDIQLMNKWKKEDQYQPGLYDFHAFKMINQFQFWTRTLQHHPICFFGSVQYDQNFAHLASFFVNKQHRGNGHGMKLWNHVLSQITTSNIGLNAVLKQEKLCKSWIQNLRYTHSIFFNGKNKKIVGKLILIIQVIMMRTISRQRVNFLKTWINLPKSKGRAYVKNGQIQGYGVLRPTNNGYKLGPLFAESVEIAQQILSDLTYEIAENVQIIIDCPKGNQNVLKLVEQFKMTEKLFFVRMFLNGQPEVFKKNSIYAITSAQFG